MTSHKLTEGEVRTLDALFYRASLNDVSTSVQIAELTERSRSQAYRVLKSLRVKGLVDFYGGKYYKIKELENE